MSLAATKFLLVLIIAAFATAQNNLKDECMIRGGRCEPFFKGSKCETGVNWNYSCGRLGVMCCMPPLLPNDQCARNEGRCEPFTRFSKCETGETMNYDCGRLGVTCCRPPRNRIYIHNECEELGGVCEGWVGPESKCKSGKPLNYRCTGMTGAMCCAPSKPVPYTHM